MSMSPVSRVECECGCRRSRYHYRKRRGVRSGPPRLVRLLFGFENESHTFTIMMVTFDHLCAGWHAKYHFFSQRVRKRLKQNGLSFARVQEITKEIHWCKCYMLYGE